ncbi:MAG TPA: DUF3795 domain-containing protein [Bacteroidales bacterium]|jgi:hypothetical protein|nr:DUF3795 domain-containing protein [Bacteroidales bacterium]
MRNPATNKKFNTSVSFVGSMIAPCGMNCGSCLGYMRPENKCPGCRLVDQGKARVRCVIRNCDLLREIDSQFCFDCRKYPCKRLKQLDKRYRTRYNTSFLENLAMIKEKGMDNFLEFETDRRKCPACGATLCVHRNYCLACPKILKS